LVTDITKDLEKSMLRSTASPGKYSSIKDSTNDQSAGCRGQSLESPLDTVSQSEPNFTKQNQHLSRFPVFGMA
jgi:hypothetical protein